MRSLFRMVRFAFQGIFRNFWLSFVTTSVFMLTLLTVNMVITLNVIANAAIASAEERVFVYVYFLPGTSAESEAAVSGYLSSLSQVREVVLITADEAEADFRARHEHDPEVLAAYDELGENPFGDAFQVKADSASDFPFILEAVRTPEFAPLIRDTDTQDYEVYAERLTTYSEKVRLGGLILASFFALIAVLIVFNTIRVTIYIHRDEIAVMRLVGAHDWFIRGPFFLEVVLYSAAATVLVGSGIMALLLASESQITNLFLGTDVGLTAFYSSHAVLLFGGQFIALSLLSTATSALAMRKYLKV